MLDNRTGKAVKGFGDYPGDKKDADTENGFAYQGFMAYQPTKKVLAIGSGFGESISFYDMSHPTSPTLIKEYIHAYPAYKGISNQQSQGVVFKKENIMGFVAMAASPNYCIGLFSGKEHSSQHGGDKLLLFDWNGNAQKPYNWINRMTNWLIMSRNRKSFCLEQSRAETTDWLPFG